MTFDLTSPAGKARFQPLNGDLRLREMLCPACRETVVQPHPFFVYIDYYPERPQSHPENSKAVSTPIPSVRPPAQPLFLRQGQSQTNDVSCVCGFDDAVIP